MANTTKNLIKNRSELVFLYDIKDANPNGDPMDENKPRIDEETEINLVTDVRLKRTIRDYLKNFKRKDIFVKRVVKESGELKTKEEFIAEEKITDKNDERRLTEKYIDLRLFGATIALKGGRRNNVRKNSEDTIADEENDKSGAIVWIGPVQFRFGRSLHRVEPRTVKGTSVMPSKSGKEQGTFIETQILPYSLISFYGIINENAAKETNLTSEDELLLLDGMWNGTKNLITRSKIGQMPRFLLRVIYKENNYHIGDLDKKIKMIKNDLKQDDKAIRDISEFKLDLSNLINVLKENKEFIETIEFKADSSAVFILNDQEKTGAKVMDLLKLVDVSVRQIVF